MTYTSTNNSVAGRRVGDGGFPGAVLHGGSVRAPWPDGREYWSVGDLTILYGGIGEAATETAIPHAVEPEI